MSVTLECVLIVFIIALMIILVILCIYLAKLIEETTETIKSLKELADLTKKEIEPAFKSVNSVLKTVDNVSTATNKQFDTVRKILTTLLGASCIALTNVKNKGGFLSGLVNGMKLFKKRR